jgi:ankyrin repeat protein
MKYLIENKADVIATDEDGNNILHFAAFSGSAECVTYLIANKMDVNVKNNQKDTPLHLVGNNIKLQERFSFDRDCFDKNCFETAEILIRAGANLSAKNKKRNFAFKNYVVKQLQWQKPELFDNELNYIFEEDSDTEEDEYIVKYFLNFHSSFEDYEDIDDTDDP